MEPRLFQNQSHKLFLSPQIRQYLKILQLPVTDLQQVIHNEISENPTLEEVTQSESTSQDSDEPESIIENDSLSAESKPGESYEYLERLDESSRENSPSAEYFQKRHKDIQKLRDFQESSLTKKEDLSDYLLWQARFLEFSDTQIKIANEIIGNINENGYLQSAIEEIATACQTDFASVENVLNQVQSFDPAGIAARTLQESLLIQLKRKDLEGQLAYVIIEKHIKLLEKRDWKQISKLTETSFKSVQEAAKIIANLNPRPGRIFYEGISQVITPDAKISFSEDDPTQLKVEIHYEMLPELRISRYYRKLLRDKTTDQKTKAFLKERIQAAVDFIQALALRKSTLRAITEQIISAQPDFFSKGYAHLKPLRLRDIADPLGIHESTVSRALSNKYVETPQGVVAYKSFFSSRLESAHGEDESQKSIMEKIRHLISKESPKDPLSDQELVKELQSEGVMVARRTVAKYRDLLKILPSHLRRER